MTTENDWAARCDAVRDLHRSLLPSAEQHPLAQTLPDLRIADESRIAPEVGSASILAQPGGFRREHIQAELPPGKELHQYAATPLNVHLTRDGFMQRFLVTGVTQELGDGTKLLYESRPYRRGRLPKILRLSTGLPPEPLPPTLKLCGFRPRSVPYWTSVTFLCGALFFTAGSVAWMIPAVGDGAHGAPQWEAQLTVTDTYLVGAVFFVVGCYAGFVEVINANLTEEVHSSTEPLNPIGSVHARSVRERGGSFSRSEAQLEAWSKSTHMQPETWPGWLLSLHWWRFQPNSLLWWGALVQLLSAGIFLLACVAGLPGVLQGGRDAEVYLVFIPSLIGSIGFVFASWVYLFEVTSSPNPLLPPRTLSVGYFIALLNLAGSGLYTVASGCYFYPESESEGEYDTAYYVSEWGVRFGYAIGSLCFVSSALLAFPEILSE
mmetsp:Transcript_54031/g.124381  ORF Transcript_54031/g.124381 Transcript_54031/m.124381 type:complete len:435 (-) Transcript_54031:379-1683(-)|eukprot:CAMPEP_0119353094 /NCGR_PEP_ID=MMETSP1334-20130426/2317_1 /TAXON_ID=127549 /ORGANISM="Calcidiscus leptoporus, Strain RCC1130" /LENGTH=434 /DNA_ID=CAMNT_0007366305 /DNA_START=133 /DNA_END=1437 /DNA_ORIENTATION=+